MSNRQRFKAICRGEKPDYWPIFALPGAEGMSGPALEATRRKLVAEGMPEWVGASCELYSWESYCSWQRYWGTTSPIHPPFGLALPAKGIQCEVRRENGWEIIEYETGARTRQIIDNDLHYIMPEYQVYDIRDRRSWEFYRERTTPPGLRPAEEVEADIAAFNSGDRPVEISVGSTWGGLRCLMGPEMACTILYDDPALAHEILNTWLEQFETYTIPLIERLRPDILSAGEDICYNHGMFISPEQFDEFCAPYYRRVCEVAQDCGVDMVVIDTDGNIMEFVPLVERYGVNAVIPCEVRAGTDLFALRELCPRFIFIGWLEKEVVNAGNEHLIEPEIMSKVPSMLEKGYFFPNLEHGMQPMSTFRNLCRFMTLLHEATGNPEGEFPRAS